MKRQLPGLVLSTDGAEGAEGAEHEQSSGKSDAVVRALFHAPFCCCSHDGSDVFNYGNKAALALWELEWQEFVGMQSLKSVSEQFNTNNGESRL